MKRGKYFRLALGAIVIGFLLILIYQLNSTQEEPQVNFDVIIKENAGNDNRNLNENKPSSHAHAALGIEECEIEYIDPADVDEWVFRFTSGTIRKRTCCVKTTLVQLSMQVLDQYQAIEDIQVEASGYLDLYGHVWGCLLRNDISWVDMVIVEGDEHDEESYLTIMRFDPSMYF